jgi:hypothetical protein
MKYLQSLLFLSSIPFTCTNLAQAQKNLEKKPHTIIVSYGMVACSCAQWIIDTRDTNVYHREYIYLERGDKKLVDADYLFDGMHPVKLKVTGYFYTEKGVSPNYRNAKGEPDTARIFKYYKIQRLKIKRVNHQRMHSV